MRNKILPFTVVLTLLLNIGLAQNLKKGTWRGALTTASGDKIPFNFEVRDTAGKQQITILNGSERLKVTNVTIKSDSVFMRMPFFDSEFKLKLEKDQLKGKWIKHYGVRDEMMGFDAQFGETWRFFQSAAEPSFNINGRWTAIFGEPTKRDTTVGEFKQDGAKLTGTFLTTTGDYRYLEGSVNGDKLYLSTFDGGHAFLFTATIKNSQTIVDGKYYSGLSSIDPWIAFKNENARLPDAYALTGLKPGYKKIDFNLPDVNGSKISINDARFKNKVVIVQMMGSWCPNCMDETTYLVNSYYKKYHSKGVEIVGLAYERTTDFAKSQRTVRQMESRLKIPYPVLISGYTPAQGDPQKSLPMLASFMGFPTTIIIDKQGNVRKIHTGFSGPGTGKYYTEFISEFEKLTDDLLAEK